MPFKELYKQIRSDVLPNLEKNLAVDLSYHSVNHTIDVETEAERIALAEGINDEEDLFLLKVACLYHDTGFLVIYKEHEAAGCNFAREELVKYNLSTLQIERICGMIMATRIPQTPLNQLEEIICDADLDYLGRNDFFSIGQTLFLEWKARKFISTVEEWNRIQVNFFKQHSYFTTTNQKRRGAKKANHLKIIEAKLQLI